MKYKVVLAYEGTRYGGFQVQPNSISIQAVVEDALTTILRQPISITGSGRTDAGVHALAQTAHFMFATPIDLSQLHYSMNGILPHDIRICSIEKVPADFHARYSASSKIYRYHLHLEKPVNPFKRLTSLHVQFPLSKPLLKEAARYFVGEHDFTSFSNQGDQIANAIRTIYRLDLVDEDGGVYLEFEGNGFLYKMVRNITGTLLDVCRGKIKLEQIPEIFSAKDRRKASAAAPPHALFLVKVNYLNMTVLKDENRAIPFSPSSLS